MFKIGDKVKIVKASQSNGQIVDYILDEKELCIGTEGIIVGILEVDDFPCIYHVKDSTWLWAEEELELI